MIIVITAKTRSEICHIRDMGITAPTSKTRQKTNVNTLLVLLLLEM